MIFSKFAKSYRLRFTVCTGLLLAFFPSCTQKSTQNGTAPGAERIVNLAIPANYISPELLNEFQKRTGIKVNVSNYSSNEELLAKLQAGVSSYDVALPSDYLVSVLAQLGLVEELDKSKIPSSTQLGSGFMGRAYDPKNKYSLPFDRGTTGIAINRKLYKGKLTGWKDLFNEPALAGKFSFLDDMREVIGAALKYLGYSLNSTQPDELQKAKEVLLKVRSRVKSFTSDPIMPLVNHEIPVAHAFMTDALQARKLSKGEIEYIFPEEGGVVWFDNFVIPKGSQHPKEAHELINFLLEPKMSAFTATNFFMAPANQEALRLLPEQIKRDPVIFPSDETLKRFEMIQDLGDSLAVWDRIWTEIKAN